MTVLTCMGVCFCVSASEAERLRAFLLYNWGEHCLHCLQNPFPLFRWLHVPWDWKNSACVLILWVTGVSCFTVAPHYTLYFVRACMPVQVLICVHAFLKNTPPFYLSNCDMLLTVWDNGEVLVDDFSNITTCSHFTYETVSDLKDLGLVIQHQL